MSTTITGIGSGFDISSWITQLVAAKKTSTLTPLQTKLDSLETKSNAVSDLKSKFSALQSSLQAFTRVIYDSSSDMWTNTKINSSNSAYATATSKGSVGAASVELKIEQIASSTVAKSAKSIGIVNSSNAADVKFANLSNSQAKPGSFSMFLDGKQYSIEIGADDSVADVIDKINTESAGRIQANIDDNGIFSIKAYKEEQKEDGSYSFVEDKDAKLTLGASSDTSNLISALRVYDKEGNYSYKSAYSLSTINTSKAILSKESGLSNLEFFDGNEGKITINGVDFEIDENTTLDGLISKINSNSDVKVKANWDSLTNKLILTSTQTGENNISLKETNTNLLNVLGLTEGQGDQEVIAQDSQTLGQNAIVYINGNKVISSSNTITGESSGINNLSITVKKPTSDYSNNKDDEKSVTLDIERDFTAVKDALKTFVDSYNDVVSTTRKYTGSEGEIGYDSSLKSILSTLRGITSKLSSNDGDFKLLSDIGISTSNKDITALSIDEKKLDKALAENFESVKFLLSDGYTSKADTGLFDSLLENVNNVLDSQNGYFSNKTNSIQSLISSTNRRIERVNMQITNYETRITNQFNAMDSAISNLTSQLAAFQSYFG